MGEVYKARDTRLDRTVAIKVLPEHLSEDPERRQQFEQEARALSSLNHPHRTDIFALRAVLYETVTGKKAFEGKSQANLIHAIMGVDPAPASTILPTSPPAFDHVIQSCLAKDPDERAQSAGQVGRNLRWVRDAKPEAATPYASTKSPYWERLLWLAAVVVASAVTWALIRPEPPSVVRMTITPPETAPLEITASHRDVALTPDGSHVVYTATVPRELHVRRFDELEARALANTVGGRSPFVSPDGAWIGFMSNEDEKLKKISINGGPALASTRHSPRERARNTWTPVTSSTAGTPRGDTSSSCSTRRKS